MARKNIKIHVEQGFTLVELLVAMVIALLAAAAIFGVFNAFSRQNNQTTATQNMWQQGRIALYMMQQDMGKAGYGLEPQSCAATVPSVSVTYSNAGADLVSALTVSTGNTGINLASIPLGTVAPGADLINLTAPAGSALTTATPILLKAQQNGGGCTTASINRVSGTSITLNNPSPFAAIAYAANTVAGTVTYSLASASSNCALGSLNRSSGGTAAVPVACGVVAMSALCNYQNTYGPVSCMGGVDSNGDLLQSIQLALLIGSGRSDRQFHGPSSFTMPGGATVSILSNHRYTLLQDVIPLRNYYVVPQ
ncbi:PilW family protein [Acidithiobacillus sp. M4-SHS-6]|uniref:PilW family protein n=1 Tax=Acidithiobacillus sp. M4-SHS-6 TaxID=3383024 RepID=UPI0039BE5A1A